MAETLLHKHNIFTNNILEDTDLKKADWNSGTQNFVLFFASLLTLFRIEKARTITSQICKKQYLHKYTSTRVHHASTQKHNRLDRVLIEKIKLTFHCIIM